MTEIVADGDPVDRPALFLPTAPMAAVEVISEEWSKETMTVQIDALQQKVRETLAASRTRAETFVAEFAAYAEGMLAGHVDALSQAECLLAAQLESVHQKHRLEVAQLCAENAMLRDQLSVMTTTMHCLHQDVLLSDFKGGRAAATAMMASAGKNKKNNFNAVLKMPSESSYAGVSSDAAAKTTNRPGKAAPKAAWTPIGSRAGSRMNSGAGVVTTSTELAAQRDAAIHGAAPGESGSWQSIVCWVPSAVKTPEPWQPLAADVQAGLSKLGQNHAFAKDLQLPGMMPQAPAGQPAPLSVVPTVGDDGDIENQSGDKEKELEFELLEVWKRKKDKPDKKKGHRSSAAARAAEDTRSQYSSEAVDQVAFAEQKKPAYVIHPHSTPRISWDLFSLAMVVYDIVMIPMNLFPLPENWFLIAMDWTTRLFWTLDVVWSCLTGVVLSDGSIKWDLRFIITKYLKTWFVMDFFIVGTDWMEVMVTSLTSAGGAGFVGKMSRIFRVVRVVRLLRLVRMKEVVEVITERIQSDKLALIANISKLSLFVCVFGHITGCIWYGVGTMASSGPSWVRDYKVEERHWEYQYLMSMHWSLAMLQGGTEEVVPQSTGERAYAVFLFIFAYMVAAVMVSVLTSSLTQLHIIQGHHSQSVATLRKYLKQNAISSNLALRVQRSAQHAISGDLTPEAVELLQVVSDPLRAEMHFEMYAPVFRYHGFFAQCVDESYHAMKRVCHTAVSTMLLSDGDEVFTEGEAPQQPKMYIIFKGRCEYENEEDSVVLSEKQWVSEPALWTTWVHRGTLVATEEVKIASLNAKSFADLCSQFSSSSFDAKPYAKEFVNSMNQSSDSVDDLFKIR